MCKKAIYSIVTSIYFLTELVIHPKFCFAQIYPLVQFHEGKPRLGEYSVLNTVVDQEGHTYLDELLELNLLVYDLGSDFQNLTAESKREMHRSIKNSQTPLTMNQIFNGNSIYYSHDGGGSFSRSFLALDSSYKVFFTQRSRERQIYPISGCSGLVNLNRQCQDSQLDIPGLVSFDRSHSIISIVLRGSIGVPGCSPDWITNAYTSPIEATQTIHPDFSGKVHGGFSIKVALLKESLSKIMTSIITTLSEQEKEEVRIVITGHSQGGALALLVGGWIAAELKMAELKMPPRKFDLPYKQNRVQLYRFASPRALADRTAFERMRNFVGLENDIRQNVQFDSVPSLPPSGLSGFVDFGNLAFDHFTTNIVEDGLERKVEDYFEHCENLDTQLVSSYNELANGNVQGACVQIPSILYWGINWVYSGINCAPELQLLQDLNPTSPASLCKSACKVACKVAGKAALIAHSLPLRRHRDAVFVKRLGAQEIHESRPSVDELLNNGDEKLRSEIFSLTPGQLYENEMAIAAMGCPTTPFIPWSPPSSFLSDDVKGAQEIHESRPSVDELLNNGDEKLRSEPLTPVQLHENEIARAAMGCPTTPSIPRSPPSSFLSKLQPFHDRPDSIPAPFAELGQMYESENFIWSAVSPHTFLFLEDAQDYCQSLGPKAKLPHPQNYKDLASHEGIEDFQTDMKDKWFWTNDAHDYPRQSIVVNGKKKATSIFLLHGSSLTIKNASLWYAHTTSFTPRHVRCIMHR